MSNDVKIRYDSTYSGNRKLLKGDARDFDTYFEDDDHIVEMIDSHGHAVKANLDTLRVEKSKDNIGDWRYIGELKDIDGKGRILCADCGQVDADLSLVGEFSSDVIHAQCPNCSGVYDYWTDL